MIRTPILNAEGDLLFIRVAGHASRTILPAFELWKLRGDRASLVRALGGEMYLAGLKDGAVVWNVADAGGRWRLLAEEPDGSLRDIGCGRVLVDPLTRTDPDVAALGGRRQADHPRRPSPRVRRRATASPTGPVLDSALGILVGDFTTREEAEAVASIIETRFGGQPTVIDSTTQPTLIRPGAFAAVVPLADGADPELELERFRMLLPETREHELDRGLAMNRSRSAIAIVALASLLGVGCADGGGEPSRATEVPGSFVSWIAVLAVAPDSNEFEETDAARARGRGHLDPIAPLDCFEGLPEGVAQPPDYVLAVFASDRESVDRDRRADGHRAGVRRARCGSSASTEGRTPGCPRAIGGRC